MKRFYLAAAAVMVGAFGLLGGTGEALAQYAPAPVVLDGQAVLNYSDTVTAVLTVAGGAFAGALVVVIGFMIARKFVSWLRSI